MFFDALLSKEQTCDYRYNLVNRGNRLRNMYGIVNEPDYIAVTFNGNISFSALIEAFQQVASLPGYQDKNRLWTFKKNEDTSLSLSTIASVISIIMKLDPDRKTRVAIVLQNGLQNSVAALFAREVKKASTHIDLFGNLDRAVEWVQENEEIMN